MAHNPHSINKPSFRSIYLMRFLTRSAVFAAAIIVFIFSRETFDVILGLNFFREFSVCHLLWIAWMFDMVMQLIPSTGYWPLGSQKYFGAKYVPITRRINIYHLRQILTLEQLSKYLTIDNIQTQLHRINRSHIANYVNKKRLKEFVRTSTRDAYYIAIIWIVLTVVCAALYHRGIIDYAWVMLIVIAFYLCDVICVYFWCPFRVFFMKNRCCTTCRIFNWDHLMMFAPFLFIPGVFTWSLCIMAIIIFLIWEITFFVHPERFWEDTNNALSCKNCTDELCGKRLMVTDVPTGPEAVSDPLHETL